MAPGSALFGHMGIEPGLTLGIQRYWSHWDNAHQVHAVMFVVDETRSSPLGTANDFSGGVL
jgi:hypothetical protein